MEKEKFHRMPLSNYFLLPLLFLFVFTGCEKDTLVYPEPEPEPVDLQFKLQNSKPDKVNTFYGPAEQMGGGVIQTFAVMSQSGIPQAIGVRFSEKSLERLPDHMEEISLRLPNKVQGLYIDHIDFGWNPEGHEPPGVYDIPHFDIHFYFISVFEKMQMIDPELGEILPPEDYRPENYIPTPGFVPMMGKHWLNLESNEAKGLTFDQTFIYGSYNGEFIFYEPMITLDYLKKKIDDDFAIFQPQKYPLSGFYYPTRYSITYDQTKKEYRVTLYEMVLR